MKKGIGPRNLGSPAKMYNSPAKKFVRRRVKNEDGTINQATLNRDQRISNSQPIKESHSTNFGVKKPKVNIK